MAEKDREGRTKREEEEEKEWRGWGNVFMGYRQPATIPVAPEKKARNKFNAKRMNKLK